jgi:hypothetical protein
MLYTGFMDGYENQPVRAKENSFLAYPEGSTYSVCAYILKARGPAIMTSRCRVYEG